MNQEPDMRSRFPGLFAPVSWGSWRLFGAIALWMGSLVGAGLLEPHGSRPVVFTALTFPWLSMYLFALHPLGLGLVIALATRNPATPALPSGLLRQVIGFVLSIWAVSTLVAAVIIRTKWTALGAHETPKAAAMAGLMAATIPFVIWLSVREKRKK